MKLYLFGGFWNLTKCSRTDLTSSSISFEGQPRQFAQINANSGQQKFASNVVFTGNYFTSRHADLSLNYIIRISW